MTHVRRPNRRHVPELVDQVDGGLCPEAGKVRFVDERTAEIACRRMALRTADPRRHLLHTYHHELCGDWHVGHRAERP